MSNHNYYEIFRDVFSNKLLQTNDSREMLDVIRAAEEALPHFPGEETMKNGFAYSYASYEDAIEDCRKIKKTKLKYAERIEMMVGVRDLPYPFTCVVETSASKMRFLEDELVLKHNELRLKNDDMGKINIAQLISERQSLLRRQTWETDPPLMGFAERP